MLNAIETLLTTHILTTSVAACVFGYPLNVSTYPAAACTWHSGNVDRVAGNGTIRDLVLVLDVLIDASSAASAQTAAEEVSALWYDAARRTALSALGVVSILSRTLQPPAGVQQAPQLAKALVSFDVVVRMT